MHAFDRRTDGQAWRTEFSSLDRVCILCSAVKTIYLGPTYRLVCSGVKADKWDFELWMLHGCVVLKMFLALRDWYQTVEGARVGVREGDILHRRCRKVCTWQHRLHGVQLRLVIARLRSAGINPYLLQRIHGPCAARVPSNAPLVCG